METLHALVYSETGIILNIMPYDPEFPLNFDPGLVMIEIPEGLPVWIDWTYVDGVFLPPVIPETPLPILATQKKLDMRAACADEITRSSFQSDALGEIHNYDCRLVDQVNLKMRYDISLATDIAEPLWASDGTRFEWKDHTAEEIMGVMIAMNSHIKTSQIKLATKLAAVDAATNKAQIDAIVW